MRELHDADERVILISDMYLPRAVISRMLERADPLLAELPLYLSSELGVQKSTKQLYLRAFVDVATTSSAGCTRATTPTPTSGWLQSSASRP